MMALNRKKKSKYKETVSDDAKGNSEEVESCEDESLEHNGFKGTTGIKALTKEEASEKSMNNGSLKDKIAKRKIKYAESTKAMLSDSLKKNGSKKA